MRLIRKLFYLILYISSFTALTAQNKDIRFDILDTQNGLANNSVSSIVQDDQGFLWFGTQEGLSRYNGQDFENIFRNPFDTNSLSNNQIQSLYKDGSILWVGTYKGLNRFDTISGNVTRYIYDETQETSLSSDVVTAISRDETGNLWVGTLNGLNRLNEEKGSFQRFFNNPEDSGTLPSSAVRSIHKDQDGQLWIGTYGGLSLYSAESDQFTTFLHDLPSPFVMDIKSEQPGEIFLGIWGTGLCRFNTKTYDYEIIESLDERIYNILLTEEKIWLASYGGGLLEYSKKDEEMQLHNSDSTSYSPLKNDTIYALAEDSSGIIWIGTNGGGIHRIIPGWEHFDLWDLELQGAPAGAVQYIYKDRQESLWVSIYNKGLIRLNKHGELTGKYSHDPDNPNSLSNDIVRFVYQDSRNRIWIGTNAGLNLYSSNEDSFISDPALYKMNIPENFTVFSTMIETQDGSFWLGSYNQGLIQLSSAGELINHFSRNDDSGFSDNLVRKVFITGNGTLWVGTNNGLNRLNPDNKSFTTYYHNDDDKSGLSSDNIFSLYEDSQGTLWIGSDGGGLNRYIEQEDRCSWVKMENKSTALSIYEIREDSQNELWISTQRGIFYLSENREYITFLDSSSGLPPVQLTPGSAEDSVGSIYLGSSDGVVIIHPFTEKKPQSQSRLRLTSVNILGQPYNKEIPPYELPEIVLKYDDRYLEFTFAQLDYLTGLTCRYAYKLDGLDEDWQILTEHLHGEYSDLNRGRYNLRIQAREPNSTQIIEEISLPIIVTAAPWASIWALIIYGAIFLFILWLIWQKIRSIKEEQIQELEKERIFQKELERQVEERTKALKEAIHYREEMERKLHQSEKLSAIGQLAGGVAHDFNNQLQGIIGFTEHLLSEKPEGEKRDFLENILMSANNASELTEKLLAFARKGKREFNPLQISGVIKEVLTIFEHSIDKRVELDLSIKENLPPVHGDRTQLQNAFLNLLLNSRDAIGGKGIIGIHSSRKDLTSPMEGVFKETIPPGTYTVVEISDSGVGIAKEIQNQIFEPFFTTKDKSKGTGMGLPAVYGTIKSHGGYIQLKSEIGKGTIFLLLFP